jgi:outer membrane protein OmpA-like peptidoglycan-associated protein
MLVAGHTDNVGGDAVNAPLSQQRAAAVAAWLAGNGIDKARLTTSGFGSRKPLADNASEEGRAKNRRVDLVKLY